MHETSLSQELVRVVRTLKQDWHFLDHSVHIYHSSSSSSSSRSSTGMVKSASLAGRVHSMKCSTGRSIGGISFLKFCRIWVKRRRMALSNCSSVMLLVVLVKCTMYLCGRMEARFMLCTSTMLCQTVDYHSPVQPLLQPLGKVFDVLLSPGTDLFGPRSLASPVAEHVHRLVLLAEDRVHDVGHCAIPLRLASNRCSDFPPQGGLPQLRTCIEVSWAIPLRVGLVLEELLGDLEVLKRDLEQ